MTRRWSIEKIAGVSEPENLSVVMLKQIREEIVGTNRRVDALRAESKQQVDTLRVEVTQRLDHLTEGQVRLATEVAGVRGEVHELRGDVHDLRGQVHELRDEVTRQGDRLENAISTGGGVIRDLRDRVERLERDTGVDVT